MSGDGALLRLEVPDRKEAPAAARKALTALNGSLHLISEARLRDAQLLVSEPVANAVRYVDVTPVSLSVRAEPDILRVEVSDGGAGFDPLGLRRVRRRGWRLGAGDRRRSVASLGRRQDAQRPHGVVRI